MHPNGTQGVVSTAEELHALEEAEFAAWQSTLAAKVQQLAAHRPDAAAAQDSTSTPPAAAAAAGASNPSAPAAAAAASDGAAGCLSAPPSRQLQLQQGLAGGLGSVSCYEGRLEYWRQLWRTLEMSDMICMIVDARWECSRVPIRCCCEWNNIASIHFHHTQQWHCLPGDGYCGLLFWIASQVKDYCLARNGVPGMLEWP